MRTRQALLIAVGLGLACGLAQGHGYSKLDRHSQVLLGKAPYFSATTADGKSYDLKTLNKKSPVYLFFIKEDCPITAEAMGYYKQIYNAYGDKAPVLGIINTDADGFKTYDKEHKLPFPTVLDPHQTVIATYKLQSSPTIIEVKSDGTIGHTWKGYSQDFLQKINAAVAAAAGEPVAKMDFSTAPKDASFG